MITTGPEPLVFEEFRQLFPALPHSRAKTYFPLFLDACKRFGIVTKNRLAAFSAQLAHESGHLRFWKEFATGKAYEGRSSLGNTEPGDGPRYKGRGPIMLTGRANYRRAGEALGIPFEENPELAAEPEYGFLIAAWYWSTWGCNELADTGDFRTLTIRINGGLNHYPERLAHWIRCRKALSLHHPEV